MKKLTRKFYQQNTFDLAKNLLGKLIIRKYNGKTLIGKITETEAYYGPKDLASHASKGKTPRTALMFDQPGLAYIYLIYGMYYCFNLVSEAKEFPAAVLIRSVEPIEGINQMIKNRKKPFTQNSKLQTDLTNGPGKFCQAFKIDKNLNGEKLITSKKLYLAEDKNCKLKTTQIKKACPYCNGTGRSGIKDEKGNELPCKACYGNGYTYDTTLGKDKKPDVKRHEKSAVIERYPTIESPDEVEVNHDCRTPISRVPL